MVMLQENIDVNGSLYSVDVLIFWFGLQQWLVLRKLSVWWLGMNMFLIMMLLLLVLCSLMVFQMLMILQLVCGRRKVWKLIGFFLFIIRLLRKIYWVWLQLEEKFQWLLNWKLLLIGVVWFIGVYEDEISVELFLFYMFCWVWLEYSVSCYGCMLIIELIQLVELQVFVMSCIL